MESFNILSPTSTTPVSSPRNNQEKKEVGNNQFNSENMINPTYSLTPDFLSKIKCVNCNKIPDSPLILSCCGKVICSYCNKSNIQQSTCLSCKNNNSEKSAIKDFFINKIYSCLKIKCPFLSCNKLIPYNDMKDHINYCEFNPEGERKCDNCKLYYDKSKLVSHDCMNELMSGIESMHKEMADLKVKHSNDAIMDTVYRIKHSLKIHEHPLNKTTRSNWTCNTCKEDFASSSQAYYCSYCDFDCCVKCFEHSYKSKENTSVHNHPLFPKWEKFGFLCNICNRHQTLCLSYKCSKCNFYQCFSCRFK